ncbi:MAG TPA: GNAT family N-acetyltransferase [Trebonia sp.]|jgi:GNAT superfamily N-acetyltransferase
MTRQPFELRPARLSDVAEIAVIWHDGWRDGHLGHVPDELVAERSMPSFQARAAQRAALAPGSTDPGSTAAQGAAAQSPVAADGSSTVVAIVGAAVAGFVMVVGDEVEQVYVSRVHRGTGAAGALLAEAERIVRAGGHDRAWLAVVPGNIRALRFYKHHGWTDDGAIFYPAAAAGGPVLVSCRRYVKNLLPA